MISRREGMPDAPAGCGAIKQWAQLRGGCLATTLVCVRLPWAPCSPAMVWKTVHRLMSSTFLFPAWISPRSSSSFPVLPVVFWVSPLSISQASQTSHIRNPTQVGNVLLCQSSMSQSGHHLPSAPGKDLNLHYSSSIWSASKFFSICL